MNWNKIIHNTFKLIYENSTPKADFDELIKTDKRDSFGKIDIDFEKYIIAESVYNEIILKIQKKGFRLYSKSCLIFLLIDKINPIMSPIAPKEIDVGIIMKNVVNPFSSIPLWSPKNQKKIIEKNVTKEKIKLK